MSFGDMWADLAPEIGRTLGSTADHPERGERVILRRASTLESGETTPMVLEAAAEAAIGATALTLRLPSGAVLHGVLLVGAGLTIEGAEHKVAADAAASGTSFTVTIAPPLIAPVLVDDLIAVHPEAVFTFEDCQVSRKIRRDLARPLTADSTATIFVPTKGAPTTPKFNDLLELEDGTRGRVSNQVIGGGAFWKLQLGG